MSGVRVCTWWTMPEPGGTINMFWNALAPHLRNWNRSLLRWNSSSWFLSRASLLRKQPIRTQHYKHMYMLGRKGMMQRSVFIVDTNCLPNHESHLIHTGIAALASLARYNWEHLLVLQALHNTHTDCTVCC